MRLFNVTAALTIGFSLFACSGTQPSEDSTDQAVRRGDAPCGPVADASTTPSEKDGASQATCAAATEAQCVTMSSCRAGYVGICDCTCGVFTASGGKKYESGQGCAECPATCFTFAACATP